MANTDPFASVIVPTRNRAPYLRGLLQALARQTYAAERFEVIVIDNSSTDQTPSVVQEAIDSGLKVRYVVKDNDGPASSRNRGAEVAKGEILAYTDSDCVPWPRWLEEGIGAFTEGVGLVCGPIQPVEIGQDEPFFLHQINPVEREEGLYPTANVFYRRDVFRALGGFDERPRTYSWGQPVGGDDTEMGWRVQRAGYRSAFAPGAGVMHQASPVTAREYLLNSVQAQVLPKMVAIAPEIRRMGFYRRYFLKKQNLLFYVLLCGVAGARFTPWSLLLGLPWLRSIAPILRMDAWPPSRWGRALLRLATQFESSLLLAAALLYGSVKHRRLVL